MFEIDQNIRENQISNNQNQSASGVIAKKSKMKKTNFEYTITNFYIILQTVLNHQFGFIKHEIKI